MWLLYVNAVGIENCSVNSMNADRIASDSSPAIRTNFTSPACNNSKLEQLHL